MREMQAELRAYPDNRVIMKPSGVILASFYIAPTPVVGGTFAFLLTPAVGEILFAFPLPLCYFTYIKA